MRRRVTWLKRHAAFKLLGVLVLVFGLGCAGIVYWGGRDDSERQSADQEAYSAGSGWMDDTLPPEDTKRSSSDLERYYGKVGAAIVNGWRQLTESNPSKTLAALIATASLLTAFSCFFVAHRGAGLPPGHDPAGSQKSDPPAAPTGGSHP
ncbi:MAG: hypothetical protein JO069_14735 [Verrucomicrobia bacterium]|nr:hypothetical protein [Verrucomicrobiota bacterium]